MDIFERLARRYLWIVGVVVMLGVVVPACSSQSMPAYPELEEEEEDGGDDDEAA